LNKLTSISTIATMSTPSKGSSRVTDEEIRWAIEAWDFTKSLKDQDKKTITLVEQLLIEPGPNDRWKDTPEQWYFREQRVLNSLHVRIAPILFKAG
jgi:hypothetical protein